MKVDTIKNAATIACVSALSKKSRNRYEIAYESFKKWCLKKFVIISHCLLSFFNKNVNFKSFKFLD